MKTKSELLTERETLYIEKMKLDRFFSLFLDKFGDSMDPKSPNTKVWTLYKTKLNDYEKVSQSIKRLDYWISK
jgi:hypothetical protein